MIAPEYNSGTHPLAVTNSSLTDLLTVQPEEIMPSSGNLANYLRPSVHCFFKLVDTMGRWKSTHQNSLDRTELSLNSCFSPTFHPKGPLWVTYFEQKARDIQSSWGFPRKEVAWRAWAWVLEWAPSQLFSAWCSLSNFSQTSTQHEDKQSSHHLSPIFFKSLWPIAHCLPSHGQSMQWTNLI